MHNLPLDPGPVQVQPPFLTDSRLLRFIWQHSDAYHIDQSLRYVGIAAEDPLVQWKDHILFYEYLHDEDGAGLGADHQTAWTGVIAKLIDLLGRLDANQFLDESPISLFS
jgi:hypothetical protein